MRLKRTSFVQHQLINFLHTLLFFGGMTVLLAGIGFLIAGWEGIVWSLVLGSITLLIMPSLPIRVILEAHNARPLSFQETPRLYQLVKKLAESAELPTIPELYYVPSQMPNAFAVGKRSEALDQVKSCSQQRNQVKGGDKLPPRNIELSRNRSPRRMLNGVAGSG